MGGGAAYSLQGAYKVYALGERAAMTGEARVGWIVASTMGGRGLHVIIPYAMLYQRYGAATVSGAAVCVKKRDISPC